MRHVDYMLMAGGAALFLWWLKMKNEIDFLARTMWGEARGEGDEGMQAVAHVVVNRAAKKSWFGTGIIGVVLQDWQFSAWNVNDPNRAKVLAVTDADPIFKRALEIAAQVIAGELPDNTNGATHYHAFGINPSWITSLKHLKIIGNHVFYREWD